MHNPSCADVCNERPGILCHNTGPLYVHSRRHDTRSSSTLCGCLKRIKAASQVLTCISYMLLTVSGSHHPPFHSSYSEASPPYIFLFSNLVLKRTRSEHGGSIIDKFNFPPTPVRIPAKPRSVEVLKRSKTACNCESIAH